MATATLGDSTILSSRIIHKQMHDHEFASGGHLTYSESIAAMNLTAPTARSGPRTDIATRHAGDQLNFHFYTNPGHKGVGRSLKLNGIEGPEKDLKSPIIGALEGAQDREKRKSEASSVECDELSSATTDILNLAVPSSADGEEAVIGCMMAKPAEVIEAWP